MSDLAKRNAAQEALTYVEDGMVLGLGTGSTAAFFVRALGIRVREGLKVSGVPTSLATEALAMESGVPLLDVETGPDINLTVDGADEFDSQLRLIKGGGAALLREKIIADSSDRMIVIADASKRVETLGAYPLPVEVNSFGLALTRKRITSLLEMLGMYDIRMDLRRSADGSVLITDGGHNILDLKCNAIRDPESLSAALDQIPGVVEHGLFLGLADQAIVGTDEGVEIVSL